MMNTSIQLLYQKIRSYLRWSWTIFLSINIVFISLFFGIIYTNLKDRVHSWTELLEKRLSQTETMVGDGTRFPLAVSISDLKIDIEGNIVTASPSRLEGLNIHTSGIFNKIRSLREGQIYLMFYPDLADGVQRIYFVKRISGYFLTSTFTPETFFPGAPTDRTLLVLESGGVILYSTHPQWIGDVVHPSTITFRSGRIYLSRSTPLGKTRQMNLIITQDISQEFYFILSAVSFFLLIFWQINLKAQIIRRELSILYTEHINLTQHIQDLSTISQLQEKDLTDQLDQLITTFHHSLKVTKSMTLRFIENQQYFLLLQQFMNDILQLLRNAKDDAEALRESEERFSLFMDYLPVIVFMKDNESRTLYVNKHMDDVLGARDWIGKSTLKIFPPNIAEQMIADDQKALIAGYQLTEENVPDKHGNEHLYQTHKFKIERQGKPPFLGGIAMDVTERRQAEEELRRLRNLLSNIINSMPSVLIGVDLGGRVMQWNREAEMMTGILAQEAQGCLLSEIFPQLAKEMEKVQQAVLYQTVQKSEKVASQRGQETHFSDVTVYPLIANDVEGAVIRIDDVTERVLIEEMMIQTEKMMTVGGLAAGMAHEINNPLGIILQGIQNTQRRLSPELQKNQEVAMEVGVELTCIRAYLEQRNITTYLTGIHDAAVRASRIVTNMLNFSRRSESKIVPTDINQLLENTIELASNDYDLKKKFDFRHIEIIRHYATTLPPIPCTKTQIEQVILNILKNAAQAFPEKQEEGFKPQIKITTTRDKQKHAIIIIEDNGPGMNKETQNRIFEPFFTTKKVGVGTGLGLSVSYFIITNNHKGILSVDSEIEKGTKFTIQLPFSH